MSNTKISNRKLAITAGVSYIIIFFAAIFANFVMLDSLKTNPLETISDNSISVRLGILAFLITAVFDIIVAWALLNLFKSNPLSKLSTYFRLTHAIIMGAAVFALPLTLNLTNAKEILYHVDIFNTMWMIGLFFFGIHLILLGDILKSPKWISIILIIAGIMYIVDTSTHFLLENYNAYADIFLAMVALPSILGEMSFAVWLLFKGGKDKR